MHRLKMLTVGLVAVCAAAPNAIACMGPTWEHTIFFKQVPADIDVPVIAQVAVTTVGQGNDGAVARVEQTIKGTIDRQMIWIRSAGSSCGPHVHVGSRGIVLGTLRQAANGALELLPVTANPYDPREYYDYKGDRL